MVVIFLLVMENFNSSGIGGFGIGNLELGIGDWGLGIRI